MFVDLLRAISHYFRKKEVPADEFQKAMESGSQCMAEGDLRSAVNFFRQALKFDPYNVGVLNDLGACLSDIGDVAGAQAAFDLAYSLDDTHMAATVNRARMLIELGRSDEAMPLLQRARVISPDFEHVASVYAGYCMAVGNVQDAVFFQKKAWLANFEKLRYANCFLFYTSYADGDEGVLAAEHRFWADTVRPLDLVLNEKDAKSISGRRLKIGYWSPDLRKHSVRYFFRPLLRGHDKNTVETYVYHDGPVTDEQTIAIKSDSDNFFDVFSFGDQDLYDLMISHDLDVLVELAGHSSHNRITFLQARLARVQITALGYPPTSGLRTVDAKILDAHVVDERSPLFYTEKPVALPSSFWCFDPMEDVPNVAKPPCFENGWVTFGCVGNIAKITDKIVVSWVQILSNVANSKLLIRSINFKDPGVMESFRRRLLDLGFDSDRLILRTPEGGVDFYSSYNEIDIILDTYPFNGGTTTCFAAYMGVPVVTMSGDSLLSRMGKSVMTNLGLANLVVNNLEGYISTAIKLAHDRVRLQDVRSGMRERFLQTSLGDGKAYARDFEAACIKLLEEESAGINKSGVEVARLPLQELLRRAYRIMQRGPSDALKRIVAYMLDSYPDSGAVKLLMAQVTGLDSRREAIVYLRNELQGIRDDSRLGALITLAGWCLQEGELPEATTCVEQMFLLNADNPIDEAHVLLLRAICSANSRSRALRLKKYIGNGQVLVILVCATELEFQRKLLDITDACSLPSNMNFVFEWRSGVKRCDLFAGKIDEKYDFVVLMHSHVDVTRKDFFDRLISVLAGEGIDIVGFSGANRWSRVDWRSDDFANKASGYMSNTGNSVGGAVEIRWCGPGNSELVSDLAVLDGSLLAARRSVFDKTFKFDEDLELAGTLLEEVWCYRLSRCGYKLAAHRDLGVILRDAPPVDIQSRLNALLDFLVELKVNPLAAVADDVTDVAAVAMGIPEALIALDQFSEGDYA